MTDNATSMVVGLVLSMIAVVSLLITVMQYRQKGPVFGAAYFAAEEDERKSMQTKKAYRYAGNIFLYLTVVSFLFAFSFLFAAIQLAYIGAVVASGGVLAGAVFVATYR